MIFIYFFLNYTIYVNFVENFFTAVQTNISDHYATFCCVPNWIRRVTNVSDYSFRNYSEENVQLLWNDLSNRLNMFDVFDEINNNENFNILSPITEKQISKIFKLKQKLWQLRNYLSLG